MGGVLYAETPARRARQVVADLLFVLWIVAWVVVGFRAHDAVAGLQDTTGKAESAGSDLARGLRDAGDVLEGTPFIGGAIASPFNDAADAAEDLADGSARGSAGIARTATWIGWAVALVPVLGLAGHYVPVRVRFARRAADARAYARASDDLDLFALRALATQPATRLLHVSRDPVGAWRSGDPEVIARLAELDKAACGLDTRRGTRVPPAAAPPAGTPAPATVPPDLPPPSGPPATAPLTEPWPRPVRPPGSDDPDGPA